MLLTTTDLTNDIATIQLLHSRLGNDLTKCIMFHATDLEQIRTLNETNQLIANYLEILNRYTIVGDEVVTNLKNALTMEEVQQIIDDCYRRMEKYNY